MVQASTDARGHAMKGFSAALLLAVSCAVFGATIAAAEPVPRVPFTQSLSNTLPLSFGMTATEAAAALGTQLHYVSGLPGNEVLAAPRPSPVYIPRQAWLFLQFRDGRLTGWKGDWARNWMWE